MVLHIYHTLFTWIFAFVSDFGGLVACQVMFSSIVGHLIVIGIVALSVHIIRSDIGAKLASGYGGGTRRQTFVS